MVGRGSELNTIELITPSTLFVRNKKWTEIFKEGLLFIKKEDEKEYIIYL